MRIIWVIIACVTVLTACQSSQSGSGGLSNCVSTGAGGTTDVICP